MMHILDVVTILCAAMLTGNELAVSLFVNPALWQLEESAQATALRILARVLGRAMPFWYVASLILMLAEAYLRRHEPVLVWLAIAAGLWVAIILFTLATLVPINNRVAALKPDNLPAGWLEQHRKWDMLHRLRILLLVIAIASLTWGIVGSS
jgi:Domain of unknown function (DUF1772)